MHGIDPFNPNDSTYECPQCGTRMNSAGSCPDCNAYPRNITVSRE